MNFFNLYLFVALNCSTNQVFDVRSSCPGTCLNPIGDYDCGLKNPTEGCYCKDGLVLDPNGNCIPPSKCGCLLPDNTTVIDVCCTYVV